MTRLRVRSAPKYISSGPVLPPNEPEVDNYLGRVQAAGGSISGANLALLNTLISSMRANSTLGAIQYWYFPSGSDSFAGAMVPLIDTLGLGDSVNQGFTASEWSTAGLKGSGSQYVRTGYIPSTRIVSLNSFSITGEITDYVTSAIYPVLWGCDQAPKKFTFYSSSLPDCGSELYDNGTTDTYNNNVLGVGTICANRISSTSHELFFNNSSIRLNASTRTQVPPDIELYFHGLNRNGAPDNFSSSRLLSIAIGAGQSTSQRTTFFNAIAAYKTAKGI